MIHPKIQKTIQSNKATGRQQISCKGGKAALVGGYNREI